MKVKCSIKTFGQFPVFNNKIAREPLIVVLSMKVKEPGFRFLSNCPSYKSFTRVNLIKSSDLAFQKLPKIKDTMYIEIKYTTGIHKRIGKKSIKSLFSKMSNIQFESEDLAINITNHTEVLFRGGRTIVGGNGEEIFSREYEITNDDIKGPDGFIKFILKSEENKKV